MPKLSDRGMRIKKDSGPRIQFGGKMEMMVSRIGDERRDVNFDIKICVERKKFGKSFVVNCN